MLQQTRQDVRGLLEGHTRKVIGTSHQVMLEETLARLAPELARYGITRVGSISGLDRLQIPIAKAVRPNARGDTIALGAGASREEARLFAISSAVASWHGEHCRERVRLDRHSALIGEGPVVDPYSLPRYDDTILAPLAGRGIVHRCRFDEEAIIPWAQSSDLFSGENVWVPYELVHTDLSTPGVPRSGAFLCGRSGLAAGRSFAEAVFYGLLSCIENDAAARIGSTTTTTPLGDGPLVELGLRDERIELLLDRIAGAGLDVAIFDLGAALGVPVFRAELRSGDQRWSGCGADPSTVLAIRRALIDAALARRTRPAEAAVPMREPRLKLAPPVEARETVEDDLRWVLERLRSGGFSRVLVVDLSQGGTLSVARVIVPGLRQREGA